MPSAVDVASRLRPVLLKLSRELRRETHALGVTGGQASLLWLIRRNPGIGVRGLAALERISPAGMSGHVKRLERAGLVERAAHAGDLRRQGARSGRARRARPRDRAARCAARGPGVTDRLFASLRRHRNYRLFFAGQLVSLIGTWMQNIALAWFVVELTHSPVAVGVLAFCRFIPFTVFGLVAGVLADRFDLRRMVILTQSAAMLVSIALAALAFAGVAQVWHVYVLAVLGGTALVFDAPGRHALTYQMVGRDELSNAVALNASIFNASRVVGPAAAGVIIAAVGVAACFALNAVSFLAVLTSLLLMRDRELFRVERPGGHPTLLLGIREGLAYARHSPRVRTVLLISVVVSTVGFNFHVLVPVLASMTLGGSSIAFGVLSACFGLGALTGALLSAALGRASWKALLLGVTGFSVALLALAPQRTLVACAALLYVTGVCFTVWTTSSQSILQLSVPDHLRGRVLSLYLFAVAGLAPLGGLLAGWLSDVGGTELAFATAGATGIAMALLAWRRPAPLTQPA
jgi:MFS family permease